MTQVTALKESKALKEVANLDVDSAVLRKSNQSNFRNWWIRSCWKSAQITSDAERLGCFLHIQIRSMQETAP